MSSKEQLIQILQNAKNPEKMLSVLKEALTMIDQGKSEDEILKHFGII